MRTLSAQRGEIATIATLIGLGVIVAGVAAGGWLTNIIGNRLFPHADTAPPTCTVTLNRTSVTMPVSVSSDDYVSVTATVSLTGSATAVKKVEYTVDSTVASLNKTGDSTPPYVAHITGNRVGTATVTVKGIVQDASGTTGYCVVALPVTVGSGSAPTVTPTPPFQLNPSPTPTVVPITATRTPTKTPTRTPTVPVTANPGCSIVANPSVILLGADQSKTVSVNVTLQQPAIVTQKVQFLEEYAAFIADPQQVTTAPFQTTISGRQAGSGQLTVKVTVADAQGITGTCQAVLAVTVTGITPSVTLTPTRTVTLTPTRTITLTPTRTVTLTPTRSPTPLVTVTSTQTPTRTPTPAYTLTGVPGTGTPTPTRTPTLTPTITPTPTRVQSVDCTCVLGNACHHSCVFNTQAAVTYASPFRCSPSFSSNASAQLNTDWCRRMDRTMGDADGKDGVNLVDYDYYRRTVLLDSNIPSFINADYNGDGEVGTVDGTIVLKTLKIIL